MRKLFGEKLRPVSPNDMQDSIELFPAFSSVTIGRESYLDSGEGSYHSIFPQRRPFTFRKKIIGEASFIPAQRIGVFKSTFSPEIDRVAYVEIPQQNALLGVANIVGLSEIQPGTVTEDQFCLKAISKAAFGVINPESLLSREYFDIESDMLLFVDLLERAQSRYQITQGTLSKESLQK